MLRFCDSFEHYSDSQLQDKYDGGRTGGDGVNIGAWGRFGNGYKSVFDGRMIYKDFDNQATWIVGVAIKFESGGGTTLPFLAIADGGSTQVDIRLDGSRKLYVTRNGTTLGSAGSTTISVGVWYYVELKVTIHDSTGTVDVRVDGVSEIALTGQDTKNTANAYANRVYIGNPAESSFSTWLDYDDLVIMDGVDSGISGAPNNDLIGDVRVEALFPNANGATSDLDGSDGNSTDNYLLVDETSPDGDTTYVESGTGGEKDTYGLTNLTPTSGVVYGMQILAYARKTDAGARTIDLIARESGGTEENSAAQTLSTSYQYFMDARDGDPDGVQWTVTSVNAAQAGVEVG